MGPVRTPHNSPTEILVSTLCLHIRLEGSTASIHVFAGGKGAEPGTKCCISSTEEFAWQESWLGYRGGSEHLNIDFS